VRSNSGHVAVVGGGLAGLVAARELAQSGAQVTVLEERARFGGQVHTERADGFVVEHGAEGFIARSEAVADLCRRLQIGDRIVPQQSRRALLVRNGRIGELGPGEAARLLGIPAQPDDLGQGLLSLRGGMGELVEALVRDLAPKSDLQTQAPVVEIRRQGSQWRLEIWRESFIHADAVILAIGPDFLQEMVMGVPDKVANPILDTPLRSVVCVSFGFRADAVTHPLDASGMVMTIPHREWLTACTFSSSKFPGRVPNNHCLLRAFFRPPDEEVDMEFDETDWVRRALRLLAPVLGIRGLPVRTWTSRWLYALPEYPRDHAARIEALRGSFATLGSLEVAGSFYDGPGIDGAVRSGIKAARSLLRGTPST
jgi:oxygen-dependent protoporphyrinogen oxidase